MKRLLLFSLTALVASAVFVTGVNPQQAIAADLPPVATASLAGTSTAQAEGESSASEKALADRVDSDESAASPRLLPVLAILALLARIGIGAVIKQVGKTAVKNAAKSYLLNSIPASKWTHILASKHKWSSVGGTSRSRVADLMSSAMASGRHSAYASGAKKAEWVYQGKTIVVTYASNGGKISNGWVK